MEAAPVVTLIAVGLAIVVIAAFLITVIYQLAHVHSRINTILAVVGQVTEKTEVLDPIIQDIKGNLAAGHEALDGSVERLKMRKGFSEEEPSSQPAAPEREPAGVGASSPVEPPGSTYRNY